MRITVEDAKVAYEKTGLRPRRFSYNKNGEACIIGTWAAYNKISGPLYAVGVANLGYGMTYVLGLSAGFDNQKPPQSGYDKRRREGYEDGRAIAKAMNVHGDPATLYRVVYKGEVL